jgi:hypothetical protein
LFNGTDTSSVEQVMEFRRQEAAYLRSVGYLGTLFGPSRHFRSGEQMVNEIAKEFETDAKTVKGWISKGVTP